MGPRLVAATGALWLAACGFEPSGLSVPSLGDDVPEDIDAPGPAIDASNEPDAPLGCTDSDGDGTCDASDRCPGSDDRQDVDQDGTPDGCDDWDCGPTRPTVDLSNDPDDLDVLQVSIDGGGPVEEVSRNSGHAIAIQFTYQNRSGAEQLEIGVANDLRLACRDPAITVLGWTSPVLFTTGSSRREVKFTAQLAHENNCNAGSRDNGWAGDAPDGPIIGVICVR